MGVSLVLHSSIPKLGMGSNSCDGNEKRTAAISVTPINLEYATISHDLAKRWRAFSVAPICNPQILLL